MDIRYRSGVGIHPSFYLPIPYKLTRPFFYNSLRARCRVIDCSPLSPSLSTQKRFRPRLHPSIDSSMAWVRYLSPNQGANPSFVWPMPAYLHTRKQKRRSINKYKVLKMKETENNKASLHYIDMA